MGLGEKAGNVDETDSCSRRKMAEGACVLRVMFDATHTLRMAPVDTTMWPGWSQPSGCVGGTGNPGCLSGKHWRFLESSSTDVPCAPDPAHGHIIENTRSHESWAGALTAAEQCEHASRPWAGNRRGERTPRKTTGQESKEAHTRGNAVTPEARCEWTQLGQDAPHRSHRKCPEEANPQSGVGWGGVGGLGLRGAEGADGLHAVEGPFWVKGRV